MSYAALYKGTEPIIRLAAGAGGDTPWTRPAWPPLADLTSLNNRFTAVYGVDSTDSNFVSLLVATDAGTYTVDWGDNTTPDSGIASGVQANHTYNYASITASVVGEYKPVVVTVTAQGGNITTFDLQRKHPLNIPTVASRINWLDIAINASAMTSLIISALTSIIRLTSLQQVKIYNNSLTSMSYMFNACSALQSISLLNTSLVNDMSNMFRSCISLQSLPLFNTAAVTNMSNMFTTCRSLQSVPLLDTAMVNDMNLMFFTCTALQTVPLFDTSAVINMSSMFNTCSALQSVPLFNTIAVTNMSQMFSSCSSLQSVPLFNTAAVNSMTNMFDGCRSLRSVPLFVTSAVNNMSSMFNNCTSLQSVPLFITSAVTSMLQMFNNCSSLQSVPSFVTPAVNSMQQMFGSCISLRSVPLFITSAVNNMSNMFTGCSSLSSVPALNTAGVISAGSMFNSCSSLCQGRTNGITISISYINCKLSTAALNDIFTGLGTAGGAQTITITGNPGEATCNKTIATGKGWTVVPP